MPEKVFIKKIDSIRNKFKTILNSYKSNFNIQYIQELEAEIKYYFDKLLIDYPVNHDIYIGKTSQINSTILKKLKANLADFNKVELLGNSDFTNYVRAFLSYQINLELKKPSYKNTDNQQLNAVWKLIPKFISNAKCKAFWQSDYLFNHIDNNGIKNIDAIYSDFKSTCNDTAYLNKVVSLYSEDSIARQGHLIKTYKTVGSFNLDIHMFLPDSSMQGNKRPVIVYFHGGSPKENQIGFFMLVKAMRKKVGLPVQSNIELTDDKEHCHLKLLWMRSLQYVG